MNVSVTDYAPLTASARKQKNPKFELTMISNLVDLGRTQSLRRESVDTFHIIITDIAGVKILKRSLGPKFDRHVECKLRILDSFGTDEIFNSKNSKIKPNDWGRLGLNLKQFWTFYPHNKANDFIGFAAYAFLQSPTHSEKQSDLIEKLNDNAVIYGKQSKYFEGKGVFLKLLRRVSNETFKFFSGNLQRKESIFENRKSNFFTLQSTLSKTELERVTQIISDETGEEISFENHSDLNSTQFFELLEGTGVPEPSLGPVP